MILIHDLEENAIKAMVEWMEDAVALEIFFPRVMKTRDTLINSLLNAKEGVEADQLRGRIKAINALLHLHEDAVEILNELLANKPPVQETALDKTAEV